MAVRAQGTRPQHAGYGKLIKGDLQGPERRYIAQVSGNVNAAMGAVKEKVGQAFGAHQCVPAHSADLFISCLCAWPGFLG